MIAMVITKVQKLLKTAITITIIRPIIIIRNNKSVFKLKLKLKFDDSTK